MKRIKNDKVMVVDCDDTLVMWDLSLYPNAETITVGDRGAKVIPNKKNINLLRKFYKLGYTILVWSGSGNTWANYVVNALDLRDCVTLVMSKPEYYLDDKESTVWLRNRVWRDPETGMDDFYKNTAKG